MVRQIVLIQVFFYGRGFPTIFLFELLAISSNPPTIFRTGNIYLLSEKENLIRIYLSIPDKTDTVAGSEL